MSDEMTADLHALAQSYGIDTGYRDWRGAQCTVGDDTLQSVLAALDVDATTPGACRAALEHRRAEAAAHRLPATVVVRAGHETELVTGSDVGRDPAVIHLENGTLRRVETRSGRVVLPGDLPLGYHRLVLGDTTGSTTGSTTDGTAHRSAHLIVTPDRLALPDNLMQRPGWGLATQLYSVRSRSSWGVGDLADLQTMARWAAAEHGADFVLVNPLHAGEVVPPLNPSPYLPTSRRFANPIYLRIEDVAEYAACSATEREAIDRLGDGARDTRGERVERDPAWAAKLAALTMLHAHGSSPDRTAAYTRFCAEQGAALDRFALWCVLCETHGSDWRDWPAELHDPHGPAAGTVAEADPARVDFFRWLQWVLEEQLTRTQDEAVAAGMRVGIVHDVAVGVSPAGADAWANQGSMATTVTVGAPPDAYSQLGQDWQQPPWRPDRLAESGYAPFREMFGSVLRHSGGLRVDHIIGLFRLWWIPQGRPAQEGTYVHYDHEALIGVLALEAHRAGAVIIGEDLGNVEPFARDYLRERGLLGTSILWFESDPAGGGPLSPERWREYCLASVTTHDLPPTAGYLAGDHIRLRAELGLLTRSLDDELAAGQADQQAWLDALHEQGLLAPGERDTEQIVLALHRYLTRTPARLRLVSLTDAVGDRRIQNQPGTTEEYPNWRVPLAGPDGVPMPLEDVLTDPRAARLLAVLDQG